MGREATLISVSGIPKPVISKIDQAADLRHMSRSAVIAQTLEKAFSADRVPAAKKSGKKGGRK
jgi:hypothetical protein